MPRITTWWQHDPSYVYRLSDSHLEEYPLFKLYNPAYLKRFELPSGQFTARNGTSVSGSHLKQLIDQLVDEVQHHQKKYSNFTLLQDKDFNYKIPCGLLVLKCNIYPFVIKLFIETPESLTNPFSKGIEPVFFFFMGGGTNRHLTGFTRIRNRELVLEQLQSHPRWQKIVDMPRKWFWVPSASTTIVIEGHNIGVNGDQHIEIPSIYCIIADLIIPEKNFSLYNHADRKLALQLCNDVGLLIDPHIKNFMIEEHTNKLVIIDTEHFPTAVGLKTKKRFNSYHEWYFHLASKCGRDMFGRTKRERREAQRRTSDKWLTY